MSYGFGLLVEGMVAILLVLTICYCVVLNGRLKRLKEDEKALKTTIAELVSATENAERAVAGLKATTRESEGMLGERLRAAEKLSVDLGRQTHAGDAVLQRLSRVVVAARGSVADPSATPPATPDPRAMAAAARAIAERARQRAGGRAA